MKIFIVKYISLYNVSSLIHFSLLENPLVDQLNCSASLEISISSQNQTRLTVLWFPIKRFLENIQILSPSFHFMIKVMLANTNIHSLSLRIPSEARRLISTSPCFLGPESTTRGGILIQRHPSLIYAKRLQLKGWFIQIILFDLNLTNRGSLPWKTP